jgi:phosphatidylserine/phosphatidylglycerophosphate/cardiolipin synthase-like enzyme
LAELNQISILDDIQKIRQRYELSFITTFNAYLPFYESVIFRRLKAAGSRVNTVLMDAIQCAAVFQDPHTKPILAGRDYTLIPISVAGGAFHPKLLFFIGKHRCKLYVGSHNLTLSGFGRNRELTAAFEVDRDSDLEDLAVFRKAWSYMRFWTSDQPEDLLAPFDLAERIAHWALLPDENENTDSGGNIFFASDKSGTPLWKQVRKHLPDSARRLTLISPFFGSNLDFTERLIKDFKPEQFIVGLEPDKVQISPDAFQKLSDVRFVNAESLRDGEGYLHAKALVIETDGGDEFMLLGSANASRAAWLNETNNRNIEAVVLLRSTVKKSLAKTLGLTSLAKAPKLTKNDWELIQLNKEKLDNKTQNESVRVLIATETDDGFMLRIETKSSLGELAVELLDFGDQIILISELKLIDGNDYFVPAEDLIIKHKTATIRFEAGQTFIAHVHHTNEILTGFRSGKNKELYAAFEDLGGAVPMMEDVLKVVYSVIFEDYDNDLTALSSTSVSFMDNAAYYSTKNKESAEEYNQTTYSVSLADIQHKKHNAAFNYDDLSELLMALNHRLSLGVEPTVRFVDDITNIKSEEELIGADEEDTEPPKKEPDLSQYAKLYRGWTKKLMQLMVAQLQAAAEAVDYDKSGRRALFVIRRLAAVLGFLHWVREIEYSNSEKMPLDETFIDAKSQWKFFLEASALISASRFQLINRALSAAKNYFQKANLTNEVSIALGLLVWLAWDYGFDTNKLKEKKPSIYIEDTSDDGWTLDKVVHGVACFIGLSSYFSDDRFAFEKAHEAIKLSESYFTLDEFNLEWLDRQKSWMDNIAEAIKNIDIIPTLQQSPVAGDFVRFQLKNQAPQLFVVQSKVGGSVRVINLNEKDLIKAYGRDFVKVLQIKT